MGGGDVVNVYDKARELVEVLKQEEVYSDFVKWQRLVFDDDKLKEMLLDLRGKEFEMHRQQLMGKEVSEEQKEALRRLYEIARHNNTIGSYLDVEYRFSRMMMDIQKIINDAVPIKQPGEMRQTGNK
jgi:cell fate (sporulation/competence/biofilm development) regulator YlbF (YheA/YmcA/DUF963 family)